MALRLDHLPEGVLRRIFGGLGLVHFVRLSQCLRGPLLETLCSAQPIRGLGMTFDFPHDEAQRRSILGWMATHGLTIRLVARAGDTQAANVLGVMAPASLNGVPAREQAPCSVIDSLRWLMDYTHAQPSGSRWLRMYWGSQWFIAPDILGWCGRVCIELTIVGRKEVTYVRSLRDVPFLSLQRLPNLKDVSELGGGAVQTLKLFDCPRVTDVGALGNVPTLSLQHCLGVTDVRALGRVQKLSLRNCQGIRDISALGGVPSLDLSFCHGVTDVSALAGVRSLCLAYCLGVTDVDALAGVRNLCLRGCSNLAAPPDGRDLLCLPCWWDQW
jgi:hypothetical protein